MRTFVLLAALVFLAGCGGTVAPEGVRSYLEGTLSVAAAIDSTGDYRGFEVIVSAGDAEGVDTLGYAVTDSAGFFSMDVTAPERGVYPLIVLRDGNVLALESLAVAAGDSARVRMTFPLTRTVIIRSFENGAWMAYQNARRLHTEALAEMVQPGQYDEARTARLVEQTAAILWSLRETYPGSVGASVASGEAIVMLEGWNDSLVVERARALEPDNPSLDTVARAARRAEAKLRGQDAALALVRTLQSRVDSTGNTWAALQSEVILAHMDSAQTDAALAQARRLEANAPDSRWATWADRAIYELENLRPGMRAPGFRATTADGTALALDSLRGRMVVLEFYRPENQVFQREFVLRNAIFKALDGPQFAAVSVSLQPDSLLNEAFLDGRDVAGIHIFAPGGFDGGLARLYNVNIVPTRYLIDPEGRIVAKYVGSAMNALQYDLAQYFRARPAS